MLSRQDRDRVGDPAHSGPPWARERSDFTLLFEALVMALAKEMPVAAIGRLVGEYDKRIWRIVHHYVDQAVEAQDLAGMGSWGSMTRASVAARATCRCFATWILRSGGRCSWRTAAARKLSSSSRVFWARTGAIRS